MPRLLLPAPLVLLLLMTGAIAAGEAVKPADFLPAKLVPATSNSLSDGQGGSWQFDNSGAIDGNTFNNLNMVIIDQRSQFNAQAQAQQSADGSELVLTSVVGNGSGNLTMIRRARSMPKAGAVRWVDIVQNPSAAAVSTTLTYRSYFNWGGLQLVGENGPFVPGPLGAKDGAVVIQAQANGGGRDVVLGLCSPRSKLKPNVMVNNNQVMVTWTLTIPAGRAVALVHCMSERPPGVATPATLRGVLKPWRQAAFVADLAPGLRRLIANGGGSAGAASSSDDAGLAPAIPEALIEARGDDSDLLALGAGTRLRGDAASGDLAVTLASQQVGEIAIKQRHRIPWNEVMALAGGAAPRVFLRDGAVLTGVDPDAACTFALATGQTISLNAGRIGWLLRRPQAGEGLPPGEVLVETADHQRLVGRPGSSRLHCAMVWGSLELRLEDIATLAPAESGGSQISLRDGSHFTAFCSGGTIMIETRLTGSRRIEMASVMGLLGERKASADETREPEIQRAPWVQLVGGQVLAGTIDLPELHLRLEGNRLPVPPAQIRRLTNLIDEVEGWQPRQPRVRLELWTGDVVEGLIEEVLIPVRSSGGRLLVPASDLIEAQVPTPVIAPATRARIAELVALLGERDWAKREAAVKSLVHLGEVVRLDVDEALRNATDPEIKARLEQVVQELK